MHKYFAQYLIPTFCAYYASCWLLGTSIFKEFSLGSIRIGKNVAIKTLFISFYKPRGLVFKHNI